MSPALAAQDPPRAATVHNNNNEADGGNFGAPPKPPSAASNEARRLRTASSSGSRPSASGDGRSDVVDASRSAIRAPAASISPRLSRHASATASSTAGHAGMPCRGPGGKYVPP